MAEVNYPFKTGGGFTRGGAIWAAGNIKEPGASDGVQAEMIRRSIERLSELLFFVGSGGVSDVYIIGNGEPPAGGYTSITNPLILKGTPLVLDGKDLNVSGGGEFTSDNIGESTHTGDQTFTADIIQSGSEARVFHRQVDLDNTDATISIAGTHDTYVLTDPSNAATEIELGPVASFPGSPSTAAFRARILVYAVDAGKTIDVVRQSDNSTIVTLAPVGTGKFYGIDLEYRAGRWRLAHITSDEVYTVDVAS